METIEQGLRRIFKNAPHIYAECVRCAKERPKRDWREVRISTLNWSHHWCTTGKVDDNFKYWEKLNRKARAGEQIGPDYPLPPDSPIRQKEVGNWYKYVDVISNPFFDKGKWYKCINPTNEAGAFRNNFGNKGGRLGSNDIVFDLSNPLPHNPETKPTIQDMEPKPEQAPEPIQKTETYIQLNEEKFSFSKNSCVVHLEIRHKCNTYHVYHNEIQVDQDNHETLLELQLEAVRFVKKRLSESSGNYSNN